MKKKLILSKKTISNLTSGAIAKVAGGDFTDRADAMCNSYQREYCDSGYCSNFSNDCCGGGETGPDCHV